MPCNLGYKTVAKILIPKPLPQEFKIKVKPPEVDQDLLEKIGAQDEEFAEWLKELDINPLLVAALGRAKESVSGAEALALEILTDGSLQLSAKFMTGDEKKNLEALAEEIAGRYQMEVLKIVAELLDYQTVVQKEGNEIIITGEKHTYSGVHKYLRVTKGADGEGTFRFEHFDSPQSLKAERRKFLGLAQKLGVKMAFEVTEERGQPIPIGAVHQHFLKEGE